MFEWMALGSYIILVTLMKCIYELGGEICFARWCLVPEICVFNYYLRSLYTPKLEKCRCPWHLSIKDTIVTQTWHGIGSSFFTFLPFQLCFYTSSTPSPGRKGNVSLIPYCIAHQNEAPLHWPGLVIPCKATFVLLLCILFAELRLYLVHLFYCSASYLFYIPILLFCCPSSFLASHFVSLWSAKLRSSELLRRVAIAHYLLCFCCCSHSTLVVVFRASASLLCFAFFLSSCVLILLS